MQRMFHGALLMQIMRDLRLARLEDRPDTVKINLPDRLERIKPLAKCVARIKVEFGIPTGKPPKSNAIANFALR